jgi:hypothetical protein
MQMGSLPKQKDDILKRNDDILSPVWQSFRLC